MKKLLVILFLLFLGCGEKEQSKAINCDMKERIEALELAEKQRTCGHKYAYYDETTDEYRNNFYIYYVREIYSKTCKRCNKILVTYDTEKEYLQARLKSVMRADSSIY